MIVGAKGVVDTIGNELVQFGPGFSVGPAEHSSPRPHQSRPGTPATPISPSRMTIDGSSLRALSSLLVGATTVDRGNEWTPRKNCGRHDSTKLRDRGKRDGFKRIRPTTADTEQCSRGPEPWPYPAETLTGRSGRSSRPSTAGLGPKQVSRKRRGPGRVATPGPGVYDTVEDEQADGQIFSGKKDPVVAENIEDSLGRARRPHLDDRNKNQGDIIRNPPETSKVADQLCSLEARGTLKHVGRQGKEEKVKRQRDQVALLNKDEPTGNVSSEGALAMDARDNPLVWSDGSACFPASAVTDENSGGYSLSVADGLVDQVSPKRSFSTLDTERYRGSLSKDATDILRSHLESRNKSPTNTNSYFSSSRAAIPTDARALISPAPPPTPPGQVRPTE